MLVHFWISTNNGIIFYIVPWCGNDACLDESFCEKQYGHEPFRNAPFGFYVRTLDLSSIITTRTSLCIQTLIMIFWKIWYSEESDFLLRQQMEMFTVHSILNITNQEMCFEMSYSIGLLIQDFKSDEIVD